MLEVCGQGGRRDQATTLGVSDTPYDDHRRSLREAILAKTGHTANLQVVSRCELKSKKWKGKLTPPKVHAPKHRSCRPILGAHGRSQEARLIVFVAGVGLGFARQVDAVLIDDLLRAKKRGTGTRSVSSGAEG